MSADLYNDLLGIATEVINDFGSERDIIVHFTSQRGFNVVSGTVSGSYATAVWHGIVSDDVGKLMSDVRMVGNSSTMTTVKLVTFPGTLILADDDKLEFDGYFWGILKQEPVSPGGVRVLTKVVVCR